MASFSTMVDDFATFNATLWPNSYGTYGVSGGRGQVACTSGFNGIYSANTWSMPDGASLYLRMWPDALSGGTIAYTSVRISSSTAVAGTDYGISVERGNNNLYVENRVDYWDDTRSSVTYSEATMAWLRIRRSGSSLIAETAPDSSGAPGTWTGRRTISVPAWMSTATNLRLLLEANRTGGANGVSEFDNVNTSTPAPSTSPGAFFALF